MIIAITDIHLTFCDQTSEIVRLFAGFQFTRLFVRTFTLLLIGLVSKIFGQQSHWMWNLGDGRLYRRPTWATEARAMVALKLKLLGLKSSTSSGTLVDDNPGLHNLCHPTIRDGSMWSKFGARGEHGVVFLFSNLGVLWFSENRALCSCLNKYIHCMFV